MSHNTFSTKTKQYYRGPCPHVAFPSQKYCVTENFCSQQETPKHSQMTVEMHKQLHTCIHFVYIYIRKISIKT